jgi:hypothetical protein
MVQTPRITNMHKTEINESIAKATSTYRRKDEHGRTGNIERGTNRNSNGLRATIDCFGLKLDCHRSDAEGLGWGEIRLAKSVIRGSDPGMSR